jgi:aspartate ammonia-lyase
MFRKETDFLGSIEIPENALYGINSERARENFPDITPFPEEWYRATGTVKKACYLTYRKFRDAAAGKYSSHPALVVIPDEILNALEISAAEVAEGKFFADFIVPAVQGGAGTSINMNVNEIIANASLIKCGRKPGDYSYIDPFSHANIFQSTNDVIPTALTVAALEAISLLEESVNLLRSSTEKKEKEFRHILRTGYTQMQAAVPSTYGQLFSSYSDALSRDWWRISKCTERLKQVSLGGGATGTALAIPRYFVMNVTAELRSLTGLNIAQAENLSDATANLDKWVEVHATLKANAVNLEKMVSDLRLLSSDIACEESLTIPPRQAGSSIMPGKVNPVIPEFVISAAQKIYSNDSLVTSLAGKGCLELNAYLPLMGFAVLESIRLLTAACRTTAMFLVDGLSASENEGLTRISGNPTAATALIPYIGYRKATEIAIFMKENNTDIFEACSCLKVLDNDRLKEILKPGNLIKSGYSLEEG